ncbi:LysR family transcriptional regulator [Cohnella suwonensis]|uniref:LysR family transcriptional regulator n=1 Tax=Cohnella suwonensis TaxID=696072 RepID=A0ABW0LU75_9BACL
MSISKASENLHLSHSALSKQLRSLEKTFNLAEFSVKVA